MAQFDKDRKSLSIVLTDDSLDQLASNFAPVSATPDENGDLELVTEKKGPDLDWLEE